MSATVCISANTIEYPEGGGHLWVYLNWALGMQEAGAKVIWLERVKSRATEEKILANAKLLRERLVKFGLTGSIVLFREDDNEEKPLPGYAGLEEGDARGFAVEFSVWADGVGGEAV